MEKIKLGRYLTTVPLSAWWITDKIWERQKKKRATHDADVIDNLERLYRLKDRGAISEKDYEEIKEKLKEQI